MDKFECPLCQERFDDSSRRARNMPCGHGFCSLCIDTNINKGSRSCPVCRKGHKANSANDLPVSFLLEEILHNSSISASHENKSDSDSDEDPVEMCSKHKKIPVYFHCKSHGIKVCHSCAILAHQPSTCSLISLEDQIEEKKEAHVANVQKQKQVLENAEKDFKLVLKENIESLTDQQKKKQEVEKEIQKALLEIEKIQQDITKKEKYQGQVKVAIQGCQDRQKSFEIMKNKLKSVASNRKVEAEGQVSIRSILNSQKWEETQRRELNVSAKKNVVKDKYAQVTRNGIIRSSKVIIEGRRTIIPTLARDVTPPNSAVLIKEAELHLTSATTTVFMDFSGHGQSLGRVFIKIKGNTPHGQQFIMLALGSEGAKYKACDIAVKGAGGFTLYKYITEDGCRSAKSILAAAVKNGNTEELKRGKIYPSHGDENKAYFAIFFKDKAYHYPEHFGVIVDGMDVIDTIASSKYTITDVVITECGIVLNY